jgi:sterol 24-C-methyltransferase
VAGFLAKFRFCWINLLSSRWFFCRYSDLFHFVFLFSLQNPPALPIPMTVLSSQSPSRDDGPLQKYYASLESRIGYRLFLGGTRHFGYYDGAKSSPFPLGIALRRMEKKLIDALGLGKGAEVLDAGCGVGHVAIYLAEHGLRVHGIDIVEKHLEKARRNVQSKGLNDQIKLDVMDYHDLSQLEADEFDGVYTMETFVHATDPLVALQQFRRVLKPGGRLALFEYDHAESRTLPKDILEKMKEVNKYAAMPANQSFEPGVLEKLLHQANFEDVKVEDISVNTLPMLWLFYVVAVIPSMLIKLFGLQSHFINTMAAVEGYSAMKKGYTRYIVVTARKPAGDTLNTTKEAKKSR